MEIEKEEEKKQNNKEENTEEKEMEIEITVVTLINDNGMSVEIINFGAVLLPICESRGWPIKL